MNEYGYESETWSENETGSGTVTWNGNNIFGNSCFDLDFYCVGVFCILHIHITIIGKRIQLPMVYLI